MQLYADEEFALRIVAELRFVGHDVLTAQEDGCRSVPAALSACTGRGRLITALLQFRKVRNST
jgi:hypothetical protein